jgi:hypothetical protein
LRLISRSASVWMMSTVHASRWPKADAVDGLDEVLKLVADACEHHAVRSPAEG